MTTDAKGLGKEKVVGIISDTHGLLRSEALGALQGVDLIIHAGDVGSESVLEVLQQLAPVHAVRGNVDRGVWAEKLLQEALIELGKVRLYVYHGHEEPSLDPVAAGCQVVISGHSHRPEAVEKQGVLYLNPGSAGPRRFKLPITIMRLHIAGIDVRIEMVQLV